MSAPGGESGPEPRLRRRSDQVVMLRLRRRAAQKSTRALRIATLRLAGLAHEDARARMGITVQEYRRARAWLTFAVCESLASEGLLTVHQAMEQFTERHIEGVIHVGLLKDRGCSEAQIRERLGIGEHEYGVALEWWRDANAGVSRRDG